MNDRDRKVLSIVLGYIVLCLTTLIGAVVSEEAYAKSRQTLEKSIQPMLNQWGG